MNIIVGCSIIVVIMIMVIIIIIVVVVVDDDVVVVIKISIFGIDWKFCIYRILFCFFWFLVESVCIKFEMVIFFFIYDCIIIGVVVVCSGGIVIGIVIVCLECSIVFIVWEYFM